MTMSDLTDMSLDEINAAPELEAVHFFSVILFSDRLARHIVSHRPFATAEDLVECAQEAWRSLDDAAKREAFAAHPRIGDPKAADRPYSREEQHAALTASRAAKEKLASLNEQYERTFGYRYLVCARGRSAEELARLLEGRLQHSSDVEFGIASREKERINASRLRHAISAAAAPSHLAGATSSPPIIGTWWAITLLYLVSLFLLLAGPLTKRMWPLVVAVAVFTAWDLLWIAVHDADRNAQEMLDSSTRARTYMSYFVAIYGAGIVFVLPVADKIDRERVLAVLAQSGAPGWLLISPLVLCAVALLFFPIKMGAGTADALVNRRPTAANAAVVVLNAWIQKVSTFIFVYTLLLIAASTWSAHHRVVQGGNVSDPPAAQLPPKRA